MKNYLLFLPLKLRIIFWSFWPLSKIQLRFTRAVALLLIFASLIGFTQVFAQESVKVSLQVKVNGKIIFDQSNILVPDGCNVNNGQFVTGVVVICALNVVTKSYSVVGDTKKDGLFLETILGVTGKEGVCVSPNCWTYEVNGNFADSGVDSFILNNGNSILFTFGTETAENLTIPSPASTPAPVPTIQQSAPASVAASQPPVAPTPLPRSQPDPQTQTIVQPKVLSPVASAEPQTHQLATPTSSGCFINFVWGAYSGKPAVYYGNWDRSYYVFVFPLGKTRDQAVWKGQVNALEVKAGGLTPGVSYIGEVFLHGAFLTGERPYWASLGTVSCTNPITTQNSTNQKVTINNTVVNPNIKSSQTSQIAVKNSSALNQSSPATSSSVLTTQDNFVRKALDYLLSQQKSTGLIENLTVSNWASVAFAAAGESNEKLLSALTTNLQLEKATDVERSILVAVASGKDPQNFSGLNLVSKLKTFLNNGQIGDQNSLTDDAFGVLAFIASKESSSAKDSLNFLIKNQNSDGGWGFNKNSNSDVDTSSVVIEALVAAKNLGLAVDSNVIQKAKTFLKNSQNSDGGFPFNSNKDSNAASSAWAIQAEVSLGEDSSKAEAFLKTLQTSTGGFKASQNGTVSNLVTAYSVLALLKKPFPIKSATVLGASLTSLPATGFDTNISLFLLTLVFILGAGLFIFSEKFSLRKKQLFHSRAYSGIIFDQVVRR